MRLLRKYIISRFCLWLIISLAGFVTTFVIVDLIENLKDFLDEGFSAFSIVKYYLFYLPEITLLMLPVAMLLASLFSMGEMGKDNELIAMESSGISLYRILLPVLSFAFLVSLAAFFLGEIVVPRSTTLKHRIMAENSQKEDIRTNIFLQDTEDRIIFTKYYNPTKKLAKEVSIQKFKGISLVKRIDAEKMCWQDGRWKLKNGKERIFEPNGQKEISFKSLKVNIKLTPNDFVSKKDPREMGYLQLKEYIHRAKRIGIDPTKWIVNLQMKIAFPFANFIVVLLGTILSSRIRRSGKASAFGIGILICFIYYGLIKSGQVLGWNGELDPFFAAWMGNIIFTAGGVLLLLTVRK